MRPMNLRGQTPAKKKSADAKERSEVKRIENRAEKRETLESSWRPWKKPEGVGKSLDLAAQMTQ